MNASILAHRKDGKVRNLVTSLNDGTNGLLHDFPEGVDGGVVSSRT
eukprot:Gb_00895 [translate_table: standard]